MGKQKFNKKMDDTMNAAKKQVLAEIISSDENTNLENLEKTRKQCLDEAKLLQQMGDAYGAEKARQKAQNAYEYKKRGDYIKNTADNEAFKLVKKSMEDLLVEVWIPNGKYMIRSVQNRNMVVGMSGNNIQLEENNGHLNNEFVIIYDQTRNSYVIETSVETDLSSYMAANIDYNNINKSGVNVYAIPSISSHEYPDILHWKLKREKGSKSVYLENLANGQVLDILNAGTEKGTNIITWPLKQLGQNQGFDFFPKS
ncbi:RICIN domain-containing protein [Bacillus thuringiensis]